MATRDISYQALIADFDNKISAKQKEYDNTQDIEKRAKLETEQSVSSGLALFLA